MTSPLVILLDFETYYDKEYSLSKMTTAEYVADKRFHVMMMAVKSRHETFNPVIAAGLSRTPDHTDTVSYLQRRGIPGETCAVLEGYSVGMYLDACKAWREKTREQIIVVGQNLAFDGLILSRHYDFEPDMYIDTMQLARYLGWHIAAGGASFAKLTAHLRAHGYNIPAKGEEVVRAMGKHRDDFEDYEWREYRNYCTDDVLITEELLNLAVRSLTETGITAIGTNNAGDELAYQSLITAMAAAPRLMVDKALAIEEHDGAVAKHKAALDKIRSYLAVASDDELKTILRSNERLAQLLATLGGVAWYPNSANVQVIPEEDILPYGNFIIPQKISATTGKPTWAFGKKDRGFLALLGDDEEEQALAGVPHNIATVIQTIVQARLDVKSSIAETRAALFMRLADTGSLPVPYLIAGAHSSRMSGTGGLNGQNLPSGRDGQTNLLRRSIRAKRPGMRMIAVDSSQIEVRVAAYLANNTADLTAFHDKRDIYCEAAARLYAEPYQVILEGAKKEHHPDYVRKRQVAKAAVLSCQFGTGARAFREYARVVGRVVLSEAEAQEIVRGYRNNNAPVVAAWQACEDALMQMVQGYAGEFGAPFAYCKEGTTAQAYPLRFEGNRYVLGIPTPGIRLPSGYWINYRQLTAEPDQWPDGSPKTSYYFMQYKNGRVQKNYTYSSKIFENAVQGTAFQTMTWQAVRMNEELQLYTVAHDIAPDARPRIVMNTHDEWIAVAREQDAEAVLNLMLRWMRTAPPWLPGLPLDAEGSIADTYGDAK